MAVRFAPMTRAQLIGFVQPYREALSDWVVEHDVMLSRTYGPVKQVIHFQALRSGAYRPSHAINVLLRVPDGCSILNKHLDPRHRDIFSRDHAAKWPLVLKAMEDQFQPSIRLPLDVSDILRVAEEEAERDRIENISFLTGLAVINAYLGNSERATFWCGRIDDLAAQMERPLGDWETRKRRYALDLKRAIESGQGGEFLL